MDSICEKDELGKHITLRLCQTKKKIKQIAQRRKRRGENTHTQRGFGSHDKKRSYGSPPFVRCFGSIWLERNSKIFNDSFSTVDFIWDKITFLASRSTHGLFNGVPLANIQRECMRC